MSRQSSKSSSRRPPNENASASGAKDRDSQWGFGQDEDEKTIEPRLGLVLAACLLLMFGFVLFNKYQQTKVIAKDQVTNSDLNADSSTDSSDVSDEVKPTSSPQSFVDISPTPAAQASSSLDPFIEKSPTPAEPNLATSGSDISSTSFNPFASEEVTATRQTPAASPPPPQTEPSPFDGEPFPETPEPTDAGDFELVESTPPPPQEEVVFDLAPTVPDPEPPSMSDEEQFEPIPANDQLAESSPEPDPFGFSPAPPTPDVDTFSVEQQEPEALESMDLAMPLAPQETEPDPFAGGEFNDTPPQPDAEPNPFGEVAQFDNSTSSNSVEELTFPDEDLPQQTQQEAEELPVDPFVVREETMQAPSLPDLPAPTAQEQTVAQDDFAFGLEPATTPPKAQSPPQQESPELTFGGPNELAQSIPDSPPFSSSPPEVVVGEREFTVTRNDSLWSIAQEAYGTAQYVPALAAYNKDRVPHPDKLKLGVKLRIPPPEVLESRFPQMFQMTKRRDTQISPAGAMSSNSSTTTPAGLFRDRQGRPVCRVGEDDTLTRIARRYLGQSSRWTEIYGMNGDQLKSPETLKPGMILRLPADAARLAVDGHSSLSR